MSDAHEWRRYIGEVRRLAETAGDAELQRKLLALAESWEALAHDLEEEPAGSPTAVDGR